MDRLFEVTSYASFIVYHIEAMDKIKVPKRVICECSVTIDVRQNIKKEE